MPRDVVSNARYVCTDAAQDMYSWQYAGSSVSVHIYTSEYTMLYIAVYSSRYMYVYMLIPPVCQGQERCIPLLVLP
jgi:hypothetical protein